MAEREGFEPSRELALPYRFSKPTPSASWVPLLRRDLHTCLVLSGKPKALAWCYVAPLNFAKTCTACFYKIGIAACGGESGIRTHGTVAGTIVFKTILFNRSSISPCLF